MWRRAAFRQALESTCGPPASPRTSPGGPWPGARGAAVQVHGPPVQAMPRPAGPPANTPPFPLLEHLHRPVWGMGGHSRTGWGSPAPFGLCSGPPGLGSLHMGVGVVGADLQAASWPARPLVLRGTDLSAPPLHSNRRGRFPSGWPCPWAWSALPFGTLHGTPPPLVAWGPGLLPLVAMWRRFSLPSLLGSRLLWWRSHGLPPVLWALSSPLQPKGYIHTW